MTEKELHNIKFPALVRAISEVHKEIANTLDSHKGLKDGEFIVYCKKPSIIYKNIWSVYTVPYELIKTHRQRNRNGFSWYIKYIDLIESSYDLERQQMIEIEKEL